MKNEKCDNESSFFDKISTYWNKENVSKEKEPVIDFESTNFHYDEKLISGNTPSESSLFTSFIVFSNSTIEGIKQGGASVIDFAKIKTDQVINSTSDLSLSISNTFVEFSTVAGKKYDDLEIKPRLLNFIFQIDLLKMINFIELAKNKQKDGSKEKNALIVLLSIIYLFEKSKSRLNSENALINAEDENLNYDLELLLKSITLKDVVETVEPFLLIIPNGNYILLILKLFM